MNQHETIIIGAGQAGLAMSYHLTDAGRDHVVFERGRLAERWRSERWDSLSMITPNWMTRLPGLDGTAEDPDGFMTKDGLLDLLERYARSFEPPIRENTAVHRVSAMSGAGFVVETSSGSFLADNVVVATGQCGAPTIPGFADDLDPSIRQIHSAHYRNPSSVDQGGVLVVGAGASGMQIAAELRAAGREVVLATGRHARAVRTYRGRDIWWWMDRTGFLSTTAEEVHDLESARRAPSLGLVGRREDIDLGVLERSGIRIAGRIASGRGTTVTIGDGLADDIADAETRLRRMLRRFDEAAGDLVDDLDPPAWPAPVRIDGPLTGVLDLRAERIGTIVWATGYRPDYPWLQVDVFDDRGEIEHVRGVTSVPGLFVLGLRFQWRRDSHFVGGVGRDAEYLAARIAQDRRAAVA